LEGKDLIDALSKNAYVIANDSGPLHLAAALGNYAFAVGRITNLDHWLPPLAGAYCSASMPKGYRPDPRYSTHEILNDWPSAEIVAQEFERFARATT
jgi:ADP-heptose:LPS heptosyltransferase